MSVPSLSYLLLSSAAVLLVTAAEASAQSCAKAPDCAELGYTKSVSQYSGKNMIKCPFDTALVFCEDGPSCGSLGFTDNVSECPGSYVKCPTDSSKGKYDFEASPGDLKYSLRTSDHNGWLLCNGLLTVRHSFPNFTRLSAVRSVHTCRVFRIFPHSRSTSYAYSFKTAQQAGLPNITGTITGFWGYNPTKSGVFKNSTFPPPHKKNNR